MGASQSKGDKVFQNGMPIKFSPDVVNRLSDQLGSQETTGERQTTLDAHVRSRIQADLQRLRDEENKVREQIEAALEKENLEREKSMGGEGGMLMGDLEEIRSKVERFQTKRQESEGMRLVKQKVVSCYKLHPKRTLECWREVDEFKALVAQAIVR